jgi:hypothetical protein
MLGDRIVIHTRRDRGPRGGYGDPLIVEINGLGGLLVIRKGAGDQPVGTTVEITGPRKPGFLDAGSDRVKLVHVVFGYALATEFPIEARCNIKEIKASLNVPTEIASRPTIIERAGITSARTFVQSFAEVDPLLRGEVRCSVLLDENQRPALSNKEARWIPTIQHSGPVLRRSDGNAGEESEPDWNRGTICVDGMLVSGSPGRIPGSQVERYLGVRYAVINLANPFLVDIRGELKPRLTPARVPPERGSRLSPSWRRIQKLMWRAEGKLWENVARELTSGLSNESFWELTELQGPGLHLMSASAIWSFISVPLVDQLGSVIWAKISQLGTLSCQGTQNDWHLLDTGGRRITSHDGVHRWMSPGSGGNPQREVETLVVLMSTLVLEGGEPRLMLLPPTEPLRHPCDFLLQDFFGFRTYPIPYGMELTHIFSAEVPFETVNRRHPLFQLVVDMEYAETSSEIQAFARGCVDWLSNSTTVAAIVSESNRRVSRGLRWLGHQYLAVDWSSVHEELRPPYTIWSAKHGLIKVEAKHFESWAIDTPEEEDDD